MEFAWTAEQTEFRANIRRFLRDALPENYSDIVREGLATAERVELGREVSARLAEAGMLVRHWPTEWGGAGDKDWWNYAIQVEENWGIWEPRGPQYMNTSWIGPAMMLFGSDAMKERYLPAIRTGSVVWCQGFSEPHGGSDLAAMRTRAEPVEGGYRINGSKIWTSYAPFADYIFLLARTGEGRKSISVFLLPMDSPGIIVRENPGVTAVGHLNEVFFTDVFAPTESLLGQEGQGWAITLFVINYERTGFPMYHMASETLDVVVVELKRDGRFDDPFIRMRAGRIKAGIEASRQLSHQVVDERTKDRPPSVIAQVARSAVVTSTKLLIDFISEHFGPDLDAVDPAIEAFYRFALVNGHGAGAHEVVLNAIAQSHLNLPKG